MITKMPSTFTSVAGDSDRPVQVVETSENEKKGYFGGPLSLNALHISLL